mgnify:CR=1 FL=1
MPNAAQNTLRLRETRRDNIVEGNLRPFQKVMSPGDRQRNGVIVVIRRVAPALEHLNDVRGGVLADGVNSAVAGLFNSFPNSIFAQNNGLIQLTGVASRYVGYFIAAMLVLLGLFPVVGMFFSTMPDPVLGGATLLMFGMVAAAGVRVIATQTIGRKETLVLAMAFGAGLGVELCPDILKHAPDAVKGIFSSGLVTGGIVAILSNALIRIKE